MARARKRVLVADDVHGVRESVKIALEAAGFDAVAVGSGREALDLLLGGGFDAVVTDIWMPEVDGLALLKRIRAEQPGLRVFAMTGGGPRMPMETAASLAEIWGAEQVFIKPFDEGRLVRALETAA